MALQMKKDKPEIPTASMADIAFLLIVFFMLTTVFSANKGIEHVLPQSDEQEPETPEEAIYIHIFVENQFTMDGQNYSLDQAREVYDYVYGKVQQNATKPIILHTNPQASYGAMMTILDQIKMVEFDIKRPVALTIPSKSEAEMYDMYGVQ